MLYGNAPIARFGAAFVAAAAELIMVVDREGRLAIAPADIAGAPDKFASSAGVDDDAPPARDPSPSWAKTCDIGKALMGPKCYRPVDESVVDGVISSRDDCSTGNGCFDCRKMVWTILLLQSVWL